MAQTLTPQRFGELLRSDLLFIINFIVGNNPNGVADKFPALSIDRPYNEQGVMQGLNYLLNAGRGNDFVEALNVPLDVSNLSPEQVVQLYAAAGGNVDSTTAARGLATNALGLYEAIPSDGSEVDTKRVEVPAKPAEAPATPTTMDPAKRRKVIGLVVIGMLATTLIITIAILLRTKKA